MGQDTDFVSPQVIMENEYIDEEEMYSSDHHQIESGVARQEKWLRMMNPWESPVSICHTAGIHDYMATREG